MSEVLQETILPFAFGLSAPLATTAAAIVLAAHTAGKGRNYPTPAWSACPEFRQLEANAVELYRPLGAEGLRTDDKASSPTLPQRAVSYG